MDDPLARCFTAERPRLVALAARVLGSMAEAEDVAQDAWIRLAAAGAASVADPRAWLTTVVARAAIDRLRRRRRRAEMPLDAAPAIEDRGLTPEAEMMLSEAVGMAMAVVLDRLSPAERVAFVLHDLFGLRFDEIAPALGRSPAAARQLASRARRRVRAQPDETAAQPLAAQARVVSAFAAAAREGRLDDLLRLLDPEVTLRADARLLPPGTPAEARGAGAVARRAAAGAGGATLMLVDGLPGLVVAPRGRPEVVLAFRLNEGRIAAMEVIGDPARLRRLDLRLLPGE